MKFEMFKLSMATLIAILLYALLIALTIVHCNPVESRQATTAAVTIDIVIAEGCRYYPVVWVREGTAQLPMACRMFDPYTQEYYGPVTLLTDRAVLSVKLSCRLTTGEKLTIYDTLIVAGGDTLWRIPEKLKPKEDVCQ